MIETLNDCSFTFTKQQFYCTCNKYEDWKCVTRIISVCVLQDRATFRRLVVKNNAKKRRMYECFIESVPLLKSLEVRKWLYIYSIARHVFSGYVKECQVTLKKNLRMMRPEEMHIRPLTKWSNTYPSFYLIDFWEDEDVDVLGAKSFQDGERIIMQVNFTVALKSSSWKCMNVIGHQHSVYLF